MPSLRVPNAPMLSYGQQAGLMCFLLTGLGATVGAAVGVARRFNLAIASILPAVAAGLLGTFACVTWTDSLRRYGDDPADGIVFVPPMVAAAVVFASAMIVGAFGGVRLLLKGRPLTPAYRGEGVRRNSRDS